MGERRWGDYLDTIPEDRVLSAFDDESPRTTEEVATTLGVMEYSARNRLLDLEADDRVASRELTVDATTVTLWWLTPAELEAQSRIEEEPTVEDVEDALAELELPGASELMREWRRDAVRAAYWHLVDNGPMEAEDLASAVYPSHQAGYSSRGAWWEMVEPRLATLPGVDVPHWPEQPWSVGGTDDGSEGESSGLTEPV